MDEEDVLFLASRAIPLGRLHIDCTHLACRRGDGTVVLLTRNELRLLACLGEGAFVSEDMLIARAQSLHEASLTRPGSPGPMDLRSMKHTIESIRRKIGPDEITQNGANDYCLRERER